MTRVALVQTYPYDAIFGGDGAYIQSLAQYLQENGHAVHGLTTDITRGRANPLYRSAYPVERYASWHVRRALRLGKRSFLNVNPAQIGGIADKAARLMGLPCERAEVPIERWAPREALWVSRLARSLGADALLLCFWAVYLAPYLDTRVKILALPGPLPGRELSNGPPDPGRLAGHALAEPLSEIEAKLPSALACADMTALNNSDEIAFARRHLDVRSAIHVGMGFPSHRALDDSSEPVILFVGNATAANQASISWFLSRVWPAVRASCPGARLRIVGRAASLVNRAEAPAVDCVGPVPDLATEYGRAQIVIAPLVQGTAGVKIKVAEAMSYGRPLVTTSVGVDRADRHQLDAAAIVADEAGDFAAAVIALLTDADLRREKSRMAPVVFENCFSYGAAYGQLSDWLARVPAADRQAAR